MRIGRNGANGTLVPIVVGVHIKNNVDGVNSIQPPVHEMVILLNSNGPRSFVIIEDLTHYGEPVSTI